MEHALHLLHYFWSFVVVLSVVVFIHEFGHYLVARLCGVKIEAFSIGFGRELFGWRDKSGTRWKVSLLPLGGYVKMHGDATEASNADYAALQAMPEQERLRTFHGKKLWQKALIVSAGPAANFLLTIGLFTYFITANGLPALDPVVGQVMEASPAQEAGLQPGDRILSVNGKRVKRFNDIPMYIATNLGKPVALVVEHGSAQREVILTPAMKEDEDALGNKITRPLIGIRSAEIKYEDVGALHAVGEATRRTYMICVSTLEALGQIVTGQRGVKELQGPIGIAQLSGQATAKDISTTLWLIALLSANLGLVNLLPIPVLDGGHLAYYLAEALRGRPLARKVQEWGYRAGFGFVIALMALTIFNDVRRLVFS